MATAETHPTRTLGRSAIGQGSFGLLIAASVLLVRSARASASMTLSPRRCSTIGAYQGSALTLAAALILAAQSG
jgi:hypothetical protein